MALPEEAYLINYVKKEKSTWIRKPVIRTIMKQIHLTFYIHVYLKLPDRNESFSITLHLSHTPFPTDDKNHDSNHRTPSEMKQFTVQEQTYSTNLPTART